MASPQRSPAEVLAAAMARKGFTGRDLSRLSGVHAATISRALNGRNLPGFPTVRKLASALEVDPATLRLCPPCSEPQPTPGTASGVQPCVTEERACSADVGQEVGR